MNNWIGCNKTLIIILCLLKYEIIIREAIIKIIIDKNFISKSIKIVGDKKTISININKSENRIG